LYTTNKPIFDFTYDEFLEVFETFENNDSDFNNHLHDRTNLLDFSLNIGQKLIKYLSQYEREDNIKLLFYSHIVNIDGGYIEEDQIELITQFFDNPYLTEDELDITKFDKQH
jgi:hypothetical protein